MEIRDFVFTLPLWVSFVPAALAAVFFCTVAVRWTRAHRREKKVDKNYTDYEARIFREAMGSLIAAALVVVFAFAAVGVVARIAIEAKSHASHFESEVERVRAAYDLPPSAQLIYDHRNYDSRTPAIPGTIRYAMENPGALSGFGGIITVENARSYSMAYENGVLRIYETIDGGEPVELQPRHN